MHKRALRPSQKIVRCAPSSLSSCVQPVLFRACAQPRSCRIKPLLSGSRAGDGPALGGKPDAPRGGAGAALLRLAVRGRAPANAGRARRPRERAPGHVKAASSDLLTLPEREREADERLEGKVPSLEEAVGAHLGGAGLVLRRDLRVLIARDRVDGELRGGCRLRVARPVEGGDGVHLLGVPQGGRTQGGPHEARAPCCSGAERLRDLRPKGCVPCGPGGGGCAP